jgi:hypothetical protein
LCRRAHPSILLFGACSSVRLRVLLSLVSRQWPCTPYVLSLVADNPVGKPPLPSIQSIMSAQLASLSLLVAVKIWNLRCSAEVMSRVLLMIWL